jgi:hypothetical protein
MNLRTLPTTEVRKVERKADPEQPRKRNNLKDEEMQCTRCGGRFHIADDCKKLIKDAKMKKSLLMNKQPFKRINNKKKKNQDWVIDEGDLSDEEEANLTEEDSGTEQNPEWAILDSGCTSHITNIPNIYRTQKSNTQALELQTTKQCHHKKLGTSGY